MKQSDSIALLSKALLSAHKAITSKVLKNQINTTFKSGYADLAAVVEAIKPSLCTAGIFVTQSPTTSEVKGYASVTTRIIHESGEWMEDTCSCPVDFLDAADMGRVTSYLRRFALMSFFNLYQAESLDSDDDGQRAMDTEARSTGVTHQAAAAIAAASGESKAAGKSSTRVTSWLTTIKNSSLERLADSKQTAQATFAGTDLEIIVKAIDARIAELQPETQT
jgi:hypothetical protein